MKGKSSTRDKVLSMLESSKGSYISGEEIANSLGISRTAIWKAVTNLKKDGYVIDSVTKLGYRLSPGSDILSEEAIRGYMRSLSGGVPDHSGDSDHSIDADHSGESDAEVQAIPMDVFDIVDSTNTVCLKRASAGEKGIYAAIAGGQSNGRGRRGRSFYSPPDTGLYMSILLRPAGLRADRAMRFTTIAAVAVSEAIEAVSGRKAEIKWVNDVYVGGRKACGILTEASFNPEDASLDYAVVGIGINVYEPQGGFPEDIRGRAGSIAGPAGEGSVNPVIAAGGRNRLAAEVLMRFFGYLDKGMMPPSGSGKNEPQYVKDYRRRCFVIGHDVDILSAGSEPVKAHVLGVDKECRLLVRYPDGHEDTLSSGEISIRI